LEAANLRTVGDIARTDLKTLATRFGSNGVRLHALAQGRDTRAVDPDQIRKSISAETTFEHDLRSFEELDDRLVWLAEKVARQARAGNLAGRVVTLKLRGTDFRILTRRKALAVPTQTARTLLAVGRDLLTQELKAGAQGRAFRLVGVGITELIEPGSVETDFFDGDESRALIHERTADSIRARFGAEAVMSARALKGKSSARD
jgi:DNA polymerase-4